jgi:phenylacetate-CoA ligase
MNEGVKFIDKLRGTNILYPFRAHKQMPDDAIYVKSQQQTALSVLLSTLYENNAFYKPLLHAFSPAEIVRDSKVVLSRLPIMDKRSITKNFDALVTPIKEIQYEQKKTGNSTGDPFLFYIDKAHLSGMWAFN